MAKGRTRISYTKGTGGGPGSRNRGKKSPKQLKHFQKYGNCHWADGRELKNRWWKDET